MKRRDFIKIGLSASAGVRAQSTTSRLQAFSWSRSRSSSKGSDVMVVVLGTAQDAGYPQLGCYCPNCQQARRDASLARLKPSLAILDRKDQKAFLVDASPDITRQFEMVRERMGCDPAAGFNLPHGVLLTHAHIGHYTGLMFYGYEGLNAARIPVYCTSKMARFLEENGPWSQLVRLENIVLQIIHPGEKAPLSERITFIPLLVPHRDEYSDTVGFMIAGPEKKLLYIPDIRNWEAWDRSISKEVERVDYAILDGTFFSPDELPGRDLSKIGHPFIKASMDALAVAAKPGGPQIYFSHLNHTNFALDPEGTALKEIREKGFHLASDGMEIML